MRRSLTALLLSLLILSVAACAAPSAAPLATAVPLATSAPTLTVAPAAPAATVAPTLSADQALFATLAAAPSPTPQPTMVGPTAMPTITLGPTRPGAPLADAWQGRACYEIFVRSFFDSDGDGVGDYAGMTQQLDYIEELGARCIWLMPVTEGFSYHGYDVTDFYAVEQDFGSADDFRAFVAAAQQRDIKVIVDLVFNHTSAQHPWFLAASKDTQSPERARYIFAPSDPGYRGPWGDTAWHRSAAGDYYYGVFWEGMPDLDYRNSANLAYAKEVMDFWLNDLGVDGFRLDAVKHFVENGRDQENTRETYALLRDLGDYVRAAKPGAFTVGEVFGGGPSVLGAYYPDQLDSYFTFGLSDGILNSARSGRAGDFNTALRAVLETYPAGRFAPFLTNHDQERTMTRLGGDLGRARAAAFALLMLPGTPFIYYGEELGMTGAKPDERLRTPMQWAPGTGAGFTTGNAWQAPQSDAATVNVAAQDADPDSLLNTYRALLALRNGDPTLQRGTTVQLAASDPALAAFVRQEGDILRLVVINFGAAEVSGATLSGMLPPGEYTVRALYGTAAAAPLSSDGTVAGYPLPPLAPFGGYVWALAIP